ncbi:MAG: hypothetical protein AAB955_03735 [Patescibacteria group bacterium]
MEKNVIVVAGPTGSGKDAIIQELIKRYPKIVFAINAVTRAPRPGEIDGVHYHFMTNEQFVEEMANGNIPEHYLRKSINAYYGLYKPELDARLAEGKIVAFQIQIMGARYLKEHYNATTFFVMPKSMEEFEHRVRGRAPMSDAEWQERKEFTEREINEESAFYDHIIKNEEGRLEHSVDQVVEILRKEGYVLE